MRIHNTHTQTHQQNKVHSIFEAVHQVKSVHRGTVWQLVTWPSCCVTFRLSMQKLEAPNQEEKHHSFTSGRYFINYARFAEEDERKRKGQKIPGEMQLYFCQLYYVSLYIKNAFPNMQNGHKKFKCKYDGQKNEITNSWEKLLSLSLSRFCSFPHFICLIVFHWKHFRRNNSTLPSNLEW